jgi:hypothetical protein
MWFTFVAKRVSWIIYQADIRDTANFGIKNDRSADTVLSALLSFLAMVFELKTAITSLKCTFLQNVLTVCCFTLLLCFTVTAAFFCYKKKPLYFRKTAL